MTTPQITWPKQATITPPDDNHGDNVEPLRRPWQPVDISPVIDGTYTPPRPTIGQRGDGVGIAYPARVHTFSGEPESGKTFALQLMICQELAAGRTALVVDFEDDEGGFVGRLLDMGASATALRDRFAYLRPDAPITAPINSVDLDQALADLRPTLAGIDGVTEGMSLHGLDIVDNGHVARFDRLLARRIADTGPGVVKLDHVTKDREGRGRWSIGGQHKLAGLNGAAYLFENRKPFGIGLTGRTGMFIAKDRPGQLRKHALPATGGLHWFADLNIDSPAGGFIDVTLGAPEARSAETFRPTVLMSRVSDVLRRTPEPLSLRGILDRVKGRAADIRLAVAALVDDGHIAIEVGARGAHLHRLVKPYGEAE